MKLLHLFSGLKIRAKLIIILTPVVITFLLVSMYVYFSMSGDLRNSIIDANLKTLGKIQNEIELNFNNLAAESMRLLISDEVQEYLTFDGSPEEGSMMRSGMMRVFDSYGAVSGQMARSALVIKSQEDYAFFSTTTALKPQEVSAFVSNMIERGEDGDGVRYLMPEEDFYGRYGSLHYVRPAGVISGGQAAESLITGGGDGQALLVVNINPIFLANILSRYYTNGSHYEVRDSAGRTVYRMPAEAPDDLGEMVVFEQPLPQLGWTVSISTPNSIAFFRLDAYRDAFLIATGLSVLLAALLIAVASGIIVRRVREVREVMLSVREGNLDSRFPVRYGDEISELGVELNYMIKSLRELSFDVTEREMRQHEAEIIALQSQINPHFLYNTLETVRMVARKNGDAEAAEMVELLSRLLRYTIKSGDDMVTLRHELDMVGIYVAIQQKRFGDRFRLVTDVRPDIMDCRIVKLVLQPVMENAFEHGIRHMEEGAVLGITGRRRDDGMLELTVSDNGIGMSERKLAEMRAQLELAPFATRGAPMIGLPNVNSRLRLHFGDAAGLRLESVEGAGTVVRITLPAVGGGGGGDNR